MERTPLIDEKIATITVKATLAGHDLTSHEDKHYWKVRCVECFSQYIVASEAPLILPISLMTKCSGPMKPTDPPMGTNGQFYIYKKEAKTTNFGTPYGNYHYAVGQISPSHDAENCSVCEAGWKNPATAPTNNQPVTNETEGVVHKTTNYDAFSKIYAPIKKVKNYDNSKYKPKPHDQWMLDHKVYKKIGKMVK